MSVYNGARYLREAIDSILSQSYHNFLFLIIDDGSTDTTAEIIYSYRDKRIVFRCYEDNRGLTYRLNEGLMSIRTPFVARMDADDIALKERLQKQRQYLLGNQHVVAVGSNFRRVDSSGKTILLSHLPGDYQQIKSQLMVRNLFKHASLLLRYDILKKVGFYNINFKLAQDYELMLRLASSYPVANLPENLLIDRYTPAALSQKHRLASAIFTLKAQFLAVTRYGYPWWQVVYLVRGLGFVIKSLF